ncbi:hypothetical protein F7D09_1929 [Bifidobacterium leontopitheci]|uniref:Uncharacterized protein n=1 Tax=Bifidobacterium leontopitheci TaxID=2650774 RepID=A0A6I1GIU9_9BIFI|nr:hypothetical protein F7D09_1929 [Bifidobacterium leontopitheci]
MMSGSGSRTEETKNLRRCPIRDTAAAEASSMIQLTIIRHHASPKRPSRQKYGQSPALTERTRKVPFQYGRSTEHDEPYPNRTLRVRSVVKS